MRASIIWIFIMRQMFSIKSTLERDRDIALLHQKYNNCQSFLPPTSPIKKKPISLPNIFNLVIQFSPPYRCYWVV